MTGGALYLYDDQQARAFEPFASTRPVSEMVAGAALIRERWTLALRPSGTFFLAGDRHARFEEPNAARAATGIIPAGSIIANARCAPLIPSDLLRAGQRAASCSLWRSGSRLAAIRTRDPVNAAAFGDGSLSLEGLQVGTGAVGDVHGWWLDEVWDLIRLLPEQLASDIEQLAAQSSSAASPLPTHVNHIGTHRVVLEDVQLEPQVILDTSDGPIMIKRGSHVRAFTRITGPCYIGEDVNVLAGEITGCSIGAVSKVRGELSNTVFIGHSNKGHDGFVGHSYLGRWVNLGAGTITSNLKNTYGSVALWTPSGVRDTGMQFLGTMFGDHVKTGIGLRLTTGTVLGAGANVYGEMPPKTVAPFSWGGGTPYSVYRADKFVETAARMMARRHVELTDGARRHLTSVHAGRWTVDGETDET
jgi:UDP-N-acetylglucosamine diphosphorylase/glucosamine-1-phosphate N-acetyltransferase